MCAASEAPESQYLLEKTRLDKDAIFKSQWPQRKLRWKKKKRGNTIYQPCINFQVSLYHRTGGGSDILISPFAANVWDLRTFRCPARLGSALQAACQRSLAEKRQRKQPPSPSFPCLPRCSSRPPVFPATLTPAWRKDASAGESPHSSAARQRGSEASGSKSQPHCVKGKSCLVHY